MDDKRNGLQINNYTINFSLTNYPHQPHMFDTRDHECTILHFAAHDTTNISSSSIIMNGIPLPIYSSISISNLSKPIVHSYKSSTTTLFLWYYLLDTHTNNYTSPQKYKKRKLKTRERGQT